MAHGRRIRIRGVVQGVGFRPMVWRIAHELGIGGSVRNDGQGVLIEAWAEPERIAQLLSQLQRRLPPLAHIETVESRPLAGEAENSSFTILDSEQDRAETAIAADAATCPECLMDVADPANRRYRYPFTNCTHCGPRFSIVKAIPYDRANTSMAAFSLCSACRAEYQEPGDRRFHAQANTCPQCGPHLWLQDREGRRVDDGDVIDEAAGWIAAGRILAIKGLGGFHLVCDASNEDVVSRLRERRQRPHKPFALLARNLAMIRRYARVDEQEQALLTSTAAPIVLLEAGGGALAGGIAPGQERLGFVLPATPLHHLLMQALDGPVVFTSGNVSNEPPCIGNAEALDKLGTIADAFLLHDRDIINRVDDSVLRVQQGRLVMLRRARGYAPSPFSLPAGFEDGPAVLAMGAGLKNTFCLTQSGRAMVSQHIGDLESVPALDDYRRQMERYRSLYQHSPDYIAVDRHPDYLSSQHGRNLAAEQGIELIEVQHHHAHIAAVLAEHGRPMDTGTVLGIALDGLGMGEDDQLWGGEFLLADYRGFRRLACFDPVPLLGGAQAMREPWRNTLAHLLRYFDWAELAEQYADLELIRYLDAKPIANLRQMAKRGLNSPPCSSAGRLFDAVAAALAICRDQAGYEAQAAMELEVVASTSEITTAGYPAECQQVDNLWRLRWEPLWRALLDDLQHGLARGEIAAQFHRGLVDAIAVLATRLCREREVQTVVLAGGVMQNALIQQGLTEQLTREGVEVLSPCRFPAGDGAISLGQAVVAMARLGLCRLD